MGALTARDVPAEELGKLEDLGSRLASRQPALQCAAGGPFFPTAAELERYVDQADTVVIGFEELGELVGYCVARNTGRIKWFLAERGRLVECAALMIGTVFDRFGDVFGTVENDEVRAAIATVPGVSVDGNELRYGL